MCIRAYLTPGDHVCIIEQVRTAAGALVDLSPLSDVADLALWNHSERLTRGIIMASACKLHLELIYKHDKRSVWDLWVAIKGKHVQQDASICYATWMCVLGVCKAVDEGYVDYLTRLLDTRDRVNQVTPADMSYKERMDELVLFACLCGLHSDDPMHRQLVAQKGVSLVDAHAAFVQGRWHSTRTLDLRHPSAAGHCRTHESLY